MHESGSIYSLTQYFTAMVTVMVRVVDCYSRSDLVVILGQVLRSEDHTSDKARQKGIHPSFETQGRRHQKSEIGYQWPKKRTYILQNFFKKSLKFVEFSD